MFESISLEVFSYRHNGVLIIKQHLQLMATLLLIAFSCIFFLHQSLQNVFYREWRRDEFPQEQAPTLAAFQCQTSSEVPTAPYFSYTTVAHRALCTTAAAQKMSHLFADTHDVSKQEVHYSAAHECSVWTFSTHSVSQSTQLED